MKKIVGSMLLLVFVFLTVSIVYVNASAKNEAEMYEVPLADLNFECESAFLMEAKSGKVVFSQNEEYKNSPASVTKIMTLLLTMEAIENGEIKIEDKVCISAYAASMGGSQVFLKEGETLTVEELIKCTVIASANDCAVALAEHLCGSEQMFVKKMNERAQEMKLTNTNFENCTGLDDTTQHHESGARDIALMSRELIKYDLIKQYSSTWQDSIRNGEFILTNTNRLVRYYDGCTGLKTGSTDKAGFCVSVTAERDGVELIAVVMGAETRDKRNEIARGMLDYGFANYAVFEKEEQKIENVPIYSAKTEIITLYTKPVYALIGKSDLQRVKEEIILPEYVSAPLKCGDAVGKIKYTVDGKTLVEAEIFTKESAERITYFDIFGLILKNTVCADTNKRKK